MATVLEAAARALEGGSWELTGADDGAFTVQLSAGATEGFVVFDRILCDRACGGLRLLPDVTVAEIRDQARFMTRKFAFFGIACGGAKAGLVELPGWNAEERARALEAFGAGLAPLLRRGVYIVAEDMGCRREDAWRLAYGAGLVASPLPPAANGAGRSSGHYAGLGAAVAVAAALEHLGRPLRGATFAVEGFGRVGRRAALELAGRGGRLRAVSNVHGAVAADDIAPERLIAFLDAEGEAAIARFPGVRPLTHAALFHQPVDVLLPCARPAAIHDGNTGVLRCRAVVPGGNCSVADGCEWTLHARGILSVPGFVANAGGIVAGHVAPLGLRPATRAWLFEEWFAGVVRRLLRRAAAAGVPPEVVANAGVRRNLERLGRLRRPPAVEGLARRLGGSRLRRVLPLAAERALVRAAFRPAV